MSYINIAIKTSDTEKLLKRLSESEEIYISANDFAQLEGITTEAVRNRVKNIKGFEKLNLPGNRGFFVKFNQTTPRGLLKSGPKTKQKVKK